MMEKILSRSIRLMCLGGVTLGMQAAYAQTAPAAPAAGNASTAVVQVTGSRIAAPGAESPSPLQVLSSADIAASGATNLQELLLQNPTMGTPAISRTNSNFSTASAGVATVDLRNLGTSRTLVLLNGRRFVAGIPGESAVDLNTIPTDFIERVELLTGGSSATYGSDAVAGVVNIITKRAFNGILLDAQMGETYEQGDDQKRKASLTFGTSSEDGGSFIMGHLGYSRQGAVMSRDRKFAAVDQQSKMTIDGDPAGAFVPVRPFYSSFAPQGRFFHDTGSYTYDAAGNVIPFNTNGTNGQAATGFNRSAFRAIAVPTERFLLATTGELKLNDNHSAFFEGNYASTRVSTNIEPYPLGAEDIYPASGGQVPAEFMVGNSLVRNPIVPQYLYDRISDTDGDGLRDYYFTRRMADFGNRTSRAERDTFRLATGLKGIVLDKFNYEVYGAYGQTKEAQSSSGQVNVLNFRNALEAIPDVDDLNGNGLTTDAICRDANARAQGCVPANVFGFNALSPEAVRYIAAPGSLETVTTQTLVGGSVNGDLWELPAGALSFATGFEWRKEESRATPDALTQAGLNAGNAIPETLGDFSVKEVFVEARVPLLKDVAFAKALNFQGAFRAGDYSTVGRTNSWNAGLEWQPVNDVKFRATRALSTRAPNINELYQAPSQDFPTGIQDPCLGVTATSQGTYDAACRAAPGVAANIAANGSFTLNQSDIQGISGYNRGNPNLREEKGRSTTVGVVWTPRSIEALKRFTFTADYFKIKIADAIVGTDRQYALDQCYGGGDQSFCNFITRRPAAVGANSSGSLEFIDTAVSNSGGLGTEGVDITASWNDKVGPGRMNARIAYTYVREGWDRPTPDAELNPFAGEIGAAKNKAIVNLGYQWGDFNVQTSIGYIGKSYLDDQFQAQFDLPSKALGVGSRTYTDLQLTYALRKSTELYFGLDNVFDTKAPPIISGLPGNSTGTETDAGTYDAIGRRFYVGLRWKL
ncbi:TonB-dependent receptor [Massilia sp. KIM]|uniref:TonB-dependent receptor domain-containing protein n=1 Tax=Massilia sp. KIM TaxID=1955422 RepID=UPI00098F1FAD|nr:TonB-dependent receptor [Massilia sp. KIM]OON64151.1 TonB-dependent receptor [Massilia sp. KIM]